MKKPNSPAMPLGLMLIISLLCLSHFSYGKSAEHTFEIGENDFLLDGKPIQIRCGEIHYARVPREYWKHRIEMVRATGMNAVCVYLFWNYQERNEGEFTWKDQADVAEFCRLAHEAGLWVILRPGPYSCAEWEMGGLPWWLLKHDDIALRTRDERYLKAVRKYFKEVGKQLQPLQVTNGGPILMVQAENEYGFYGDDVEYMEEIRVALVDAGFDVPLFACNPPYHLKRGFNEKLFQVVNFGRNPEGAFKALRKVQPKGPLMCGEFYPAWFDTWGNPHHDGDPKNYIPTLDRMMAQNASFSIYMVHGGTTFGFWAGADRPFKPDTSSYDYDAPVSEAGWKTDGFYALREMVQKYLPEGEHIPEAPDENPVIEIDEFSLYKTASVFENLPKPVISEMPLNFERLDVSRGAVLYRSTIRAGEAGILSAEAINDFGWVYLDGELLGITDRRSRTFSIEIPKRKKEAVLDIFVWSMGRINFGPEVHDRKGINGGVTLETDTGKFELVGKWEQFKLPMHNDYLADLQYTENTDQKYPSFWNTTFDLQKVGDTFLDVSHFGKGIVWINGHALGRFWNIGPTQTMYVPGPWLKKNGNELIIFDLLGPEKPMLRGLKQPILNTLRPELDFSGPRRPLRQLNVSDDQLAVKGSLDQSGTIKEVFLPNTKEGRFFCLQTLNAHDKGRVASVGEIDLVDEKGEIISHEMWTIAYVSSEERYEMDGTAENAIDGQTSSVWSTYFAHNTRKHPHAIVIDLGKQESISAVRIVPAPGDDLKGRIKDFSIYVGDELVSVPAQD